MRRTLHVLVVTALVALTACDSGDGGTATTTALEASTTSASTTSTTAPEPTTTTALVAACPEVPMPAEVEDRSEAGADVDGDGREDLVSTFRSDGEWQLHVAPAAGGGASLVVESFGGSVAVVGGSDVDGDGTDEVWSRIGSGASAVILAITDFEACQLAWVTTDTGARAELPVGGSVGTASGISCSPAPDTAHVTTYQAVLMGEGPDYDVTAQELRLDGAVLRAGATSTTVVSARTPEFSRYTSFDCGDLSL